MSLADEERLPLRAASKQFHVSSGLDGVRLATITATTDTTLRKVMMAFHLHGEGLVTLLRGVQPLLPEATISEAGLEDGEELSLIRSKKYYETAGLGDDAMQLAVLEQYKDLMGGIYVKIPETIERIADYAFSDCSSLIEVLIPNGVTSIGDSAFDRCSGLAEVVIPDAVSSIGNWAFNACKRLIKVVMPQSLTSIGVAAFRDCSRLSQLEVLGSS